MARRVQEKSGTDENPPPITFQVQKGTFYPGGEGFIHRERILFGGPRQARTDDPRIKSPLLYQLS